MASLFYPKLVIVRRPLFSIHIYTNRHFVSLCGIEVGAKEEPMEHLHRYGKLCWKTFRLLLFVVQYLLRAIKFDFADSLPKAGITSGWIKLIIQHKLNICLFLDKR